MVDALCKDIAFRHKYLDGEKIETVYFGGGTPSLLSPHHLESIFNALTKYFTIKADAEITLECNPDDITDSYLASIKQSGINRLSIGIQSFFEEDLRFMNRAHNALEADLSIQSALHAGFDNITIDLIYGANTTTMDKWMANVQKALSFDIPHISSYCLTIEEKTVFDHWVKTQKMQSPDDHLANAQFEYLIASLTKNGYDHYEISNFGKPGKHAVHNTNYWRGNKYLGIGPSAHSYNGDERSWAVANNSLYLASIDSGASYIESEILSPDDKYNEYIMIGLRTMWGIDLEIVKNKFGQSYYDHCIQALDNVWLKDKITIDHQTSPNAPFKICLNHEGKFFADKIASELFI